ncbi:hypothetical protein POM88_023615 [Heracleum sosnowskyi]|uniref:Uncharacterized protein n=1 Tax=Heracleum sosnowskyi TaxID=360622 RepID=A0AAD8IHM9_9APIA|nr:hypothetical protein POM88_053668 [Heracleum sosnowskyi]KAK1385880.1 hypothetical protein POM88_023615 [Heracleum sosnowskyi]
MICNLALFPSDQGNTNQLNKLTSLLPCVTLNAPSHIWTSGSDAILLGAETLRDLYPVETISIVGKICAEVEILSILRESEDSDLENGIVGLSQKEMEEETESFYPEFTPASFFHGLVKSGRKQLVVGLFLAGSAVAFYATRNERVNQILQQTETSTSIDEVSENPRRY